MIGQLPVEVGGSYTTGVCNVVYELSKCATENVEIVVYATNMKDSASRMEGHTKFRGTQLDIFATIRHFIVHPIETSREWYFYKKKCYASILRFEAYRYNIERIIEEEKPDALHIMSVLQMASCYFANKKYHLPTILTLHGVNFDQGSLDYVGVELADIITGLTPETLEGIGKLGVAQDKVRMVPNGTDTTKFYFDETERIKLRRELGVSDDTTILLTIGSLSHRKGQLSFLSMLKELPNEFKYLYLIIGKGEDGEKIVKYITDNNLQDRVLVVGYVKNSDLYRYHSAADVYVHSSRWEGQALSEVEAYATDLKIALNRDVIRTVITDTTNHEDYWIFDFDTFNVDAFMEWASQHKEDRKTRRLYDWKKIFDMYVDIYINLIEKN